MNTLRDKNGRFKKHPKPSEKNTLMGAAWFFWGVIFCLAAQFLIVAVASLLRG